MTTRALGATGLKSTRLALGLAALGRPAYINRGREYDFPEGRSRAEMRARTHAMLDVALELGIRAFDAARSYGLAERFLADWIEARDLDPGDVFVSSKWGYTYVADWRMDAERHEVKSHDLATFERQWSASRETLWSHLDLYQVHSLTVDSPLFTDDRLQDALSRLREEHGLAIGATVTGAEQARTVHRIVELEWNGRRLFDSIQATFNLLETSAGPALAEAHGEGLGVIIKEPLANGRLAPGRTDAAGEALLRFAETRGTNADVVAIAAALSRPWADVVLSGAVTRTQLRSNRAALDFEWDEGAEQLLATMAVEPDRYWADRAQSPWG
jgi:aryl-alcohol dehydrogenase-like predicted oxidoreductase